MTPRLNLNTDALAQHVNSDRWRDSKSNRPVEFRLDSDGSGIAVSIPSPARLAVLLTVADADAYRRGSTFLTRPPGSDDEPQAIALADLAEPLREILASLPARSDSGLPYRDLVRAASTPSPRFDAYLLSVLRAFRTSLPAVPVRPKALGTATPARTDAERKQAQRERDTLAETASSLWWLHEYLSDEDDPTESGSPVPAPALFDEAVSALEDLEGEPIDEDDDTSPLFRIPRPMTFYRVADALLGPRKRTKHGYVYNLKEVALMAPIVTRDELIAEMARQEREALARVSSSTRAGSDRLAPVIPLRAVV